MYFITKEIHFCITQYIVVPTSVPTSLMAVNQAEEEYNVIVVKNK